MKSEICVKKVTKWGGRINAGGKIYMSKKYIGRLVYIVPLSKKEEKEYYNEIRKIEQEKRRITERYKIHLNKLKEMRKNDR